MCKYISREGCSREFGLVVPGNFVARCRADKPHAKKLIEILKTELEKKLKLGHIKISTRVGEVMLLNKIHSF